MDKNGLERERKLGRKTRQQHKKEQKRSKGKMQENPQKNEVDIQFGHACIIHVVWVVYTAQHNTTHYITVCYVVLVIG